MNIAMVGVLFIGRFNRTMYCSHGNYLFCYFPGGSLADVISTNESQMKVMSEPELKLLLCQVSQVKFEICLSFDGKRK